MWRHVSAHRATTKYFSNSFLFRSKIEKEGLPRGGTPALETSAQRLGEKLMHTSKKQVLASAVRVCLSRKQLL
jgi:hypothetical protein